MSKSSGPIILEHRVDLYVPSQCICGQIIPENVRTEVLHSVKEKFDEWFGAHTEAPISGDWPLPDGKRAKEEVADIFSFCTAEAFEQHCQDVDDLAVDVANRLTQDRVLRVFDNLKVALWPNTVHGLKKGKNCSCKGVAGTGSPAPVKSLGIKDAAWLPKMLYIRGILSSSKFSADYARKLFCDALNYDFVSGDLPTAGWPETLRELAGAAPTLLAHQNGFKIVHLRLAAEELKRSAERQIIQRIFKDDPTFRGLFVVSDRAGKSWELVNVKAHGDDAKRLSLRRMRVGIDAVRTATERLATLEIVATEEEAITPAEIQTRHDKAFDVEAVTKAFFTEVANWYFWALKHTHFPEHAPKEQDGHDHVSVIRMITRLVFCWFLKEKGLIPADFFDERKLAELLPGFAPGKTSNKDSVFYKAILQNLFFATLNTEMDKRGWTKDEQNFMAHSLYRYKDLFGKPGEALKIFKDIPFLNGGLFECLDKDLGEGKRPRYIRIDGFSRRSDSQPVVPDFLFFGAERELDLSEDYGDKAFRKVKVRGLIAIMSHYRFTVEESTPLEEEVALDPELAGKIFENLLAAFNPETGTTARKQSGSFYTPREIVNYMVDEALIAYLKGKVEQADPKATDVEPRLRHLFSYEDEGHRFTPKEVDLLIAGIDQLKTLDPAVGSGAFPMGILHKLVFILGRLDPRNEKWKERQKLRLREAMDAAERIEDATVRERHLQDLEQQMVGLEDAFEKNALDYNRKLYLIENCLYGVDIQPIAVQIAKMRFFISLIADQKVDPTAENLGVRPLPNLETKLVAANTLIAIEKPAKPELRNLKIGALEAELCRVRARFFLARTPASKAKCREQDRKLRAEIAELLKKDGWNNTTAKQLAAWDPYDQNASAEFFDPEWMFGIMAGFDVVIGNPPYVRIQVLNQSDPSQVLYFNEHYESAGSGSYDLYVVFVERGLELTSKYGNLAYILPHKFTNLPYGESLRGVLSKGKHLRHLVHFGDQQVFTGATIYVCLLFLAKDGVESCDWVRVEDLPDWLSTQRAPRAILPFIRFKKDPWNVVVGPALGLFEKLQKIPQSLGDVAKIWQGIVTSADRLYILRQEKKPAKGIVTVCDSDGHLWELEVQATRPVINDVTLQSFSEPLPTHRLVLPYRMRENRQELIPVGIFKEEMPLAWKYLKAHESQLRARESGRADCDAWYGYIYPKNLALFEGPKLIVQVVSQIGRYAYDGQSVFFTGGGNGPYYGLRWADTDCRLSIHYLQALLNSKLLDFYLHRISTTFRGGYYSYGKQFIAQLPLRIVDLDKQSGQSEHNALTALVGRILTLKREAPDAATKDLVREIDERVYKLYGLTKDEIKIVEEGR